MKTKHMMFTSSLILFVLGIGLSFLPEEINTYFNSSFNIFNILVLQLLGALYLAFAILNWMSKENLIGGIYSKPLIISNLLNFGVSAIALIKILPKIESNFGFFLGLTICFSVFAIYFLYIFLNNPKKVA